MNDLPTDRRYTAEHEWVLEVAPGRYRIGITDHAQEALGDVVYVDLPSAGSAVVAGAAIGEIESTKSVSDLFAPVSGNVVEVNEDLVADPSLTNHDPYGAGWLCVIEGSLDDALLDAAGYAELIG